METIARLPCDVKEFLLEQACIVGISSIYSCKALWYAELDPRRPDHSMKKTEAVQLYKAIVSVLRRALECCLEPAPVFRDPDWWFTG
jgi:formamidopyrimidine-DNA glycosylase